MAEPTVQNNGEEAFRGTPQSPTPFDEDLPFDNELMSVLATAPRCTRNLQWQPATSVEPLETTEEPTTDTITETVKPPDSLLSVTTHADRMRAQLAPWVLGILAGVLAFGAAGSLLGTTTWAHVHDYLTLVLTGVFGLAGYVLGFYFGSGGTTTGGKT